MYILIECLLQRLKRVDAKVLAAATTATTTELKFGTKSLGSVRVREAACGSGP